MLLFKESESFIEGPEKAPTNVINSASSLCCNGSTYNMFRLSAVTGRMRGPTQVQILATHRTVEINILDAFMAAAPFLGTKYLWYHFEWFAPKTGLQSEMG